ncbi:MAG: SOS response-associated peptidase, partial [Bifidobacteriaceae bacterium]|nr:SOS response-associated peptidase [Bifidobacteriaceae bacterium]
VFDADALTDLPGPSWNVAPTNAIALVREFAPKAPGAAPTNPAGPANPTARAAGPAPAGPAPAAEDRRRRQIRAARWGLVPSWADDLSIGARLINARSETITVKPSFRAAARWRRALIPAAGYYEWQAGGQGPKTPFYLHPQDDGVIAMAALYEWWRPGRGGSDLASDPSARPEPLLSATVVTRAATDSLGAIHDRMPLVVPPELWEAWLSAEVNTAAAVAALVEAVPDPVLVPREVGRAVGSVRNNGPGLIAPVR